MGRLKMLCMYTNDKYVICTYKCIDINIIYIYRYFCLVGRANIFLVCRRDHLDFSASVKNRCGGHGALLLFLSLQGEFALDGFCAPHQTVFAKRTESNKSYISPRRAIATNILYSQKRATKMHRGNIYIYEHTYKHTCTYMDIYI